MSLKEISIEIISKCPNNCVHCSSKASMECAEIIPYNVFCTVIDGAKKLGLTTISFSGGEPFLHPDFAKMINYAFDNNIDCYVYTSGIYVYENNESASLPYSLLQNISGKVRKLIFNMEAADENTYNYIMGTQDNFKYLKNLFKMPMN